MQNSSGDESVISSNVASGASHGSSSSGVRSRTLRRRTSQSTSRVRRTSNLSSASGVRRTSNLSSASRVKRTSNVSSSDDEGFDHSYPSARALQTRKSLRKISFTEENEELERRPSSRRISSKGSLEKSMSQLSIESALSADPGIAFLDDPPEQMTRGRKIALKLMDKKWYNPLVDEDKTASVKEADPECANVDTCDGPNLQKAWAYFEHVTLSRYVVERHNVDVDKWGMFAKFIHSFKNYDEEMDLAQPGEKNRPSKLYDPITTPHRQLGDFGLGFALYFSTLRAIGYILFVAGIVNIFNIYFFASKHYTIPGELANQPHLYGSAICTNTSWVLCVDCQCDNATQGWQRTNRCAREDEEGLTFILKNKCLHETGALRALALFNYVTIFFLLVSMFLLGIHLRKETVAFDEDRQTAQDYSILISNPPAKSSDPDQWRQYFEKNFPGVRCAAITCAVNNDLLVQALVARREVLRMLELSLEPGTSMDIDNLALLAAKAAQQDKGFLKRVWRLFVPGLPHLLSRLVSLNTSIKGLAQLSYPCTKVFVTFEKEAHQREVLTKLSVGGWHIKKNNAKVLGDQKYLFRDTVLKVLASVEPNSVRWQNLNATTSERMNQQLVTGTLCFGIILAGAQIVALADRLHILGAAFCISVLNLLFPELAKILVNLEAHPNESKLQMSLYWKIALFRWVNTAVVITVITPFTHTLSLEEGLIPQIYSIFFAEIITTNVIQVTDVYGHFQRHFLAPRAVTQDRMNLYFLGNEVELAERYTNMTKIIFLAFWYCSIFPTALLFAAAAMLINYYTDKFSLMRTWKRAPHVSTEIATYSRHYFFSTTLMFLAGMSSFYWSAYPFDNMCEVSDQNLYDVREGNYSTRIDDRFGTGFEEKDIEFKIGDQLYEFCEQDFILGSMGVTFPFSEGDWMGRQQKWVARLFAATSIGVVVATGAKFLVSWIIKVKKKFAENTYTEKTVRKDQGIDFHNVHNITGFIPQVRSPIFSYPLIACKCDRIGEELYDWTDPDRDHTYYDLTKDTDHVLSGYRRSNKRSFSCVKHYPPNPKQSIRARKRALEKRINRSKSIFNSTNSQSSNIASGHRRRRRVGKFAQSSSEYDSSSDSADADDEKKISRRDEPSVQNPSL